MSPQKEELLMSNRKELIKLGDKEWQQKLTEASGRKTQIKSAKKSLTSRDRF